MFQWVKDAQRYISSRHITNVYLQLYGTSKSGKTTLFQRIANKDAGKTTEDKEESYCQTLVGTGTQNNTNQFACHVWTSPSLVSPPKDGIRGIIVMVDASEPNEWTEIQPLLNQAKIPMCIVLNKVDLCYRSPTPTTSMVLSTLGLLSHEHQKNVFVCMLSLHHSVAPATNNDVNKVLYQFCERITAIV